MKNGILPLVVLFYSLTSISQEISTVWNYSTPGTPSVKPPMEYGYQLTDNLILLADSTVVFGKVLSSKLILSRIDKNGQLIFSKQIELPGFYVSEFLLSALPGNNSFVVAAAQANSRDHFTDIAAFDPDFNIIWIRKLPNYEEFNTYSALRDIIILPSGNIIVAGQYHHDVGLGLNNKTWIWGLSSEGDSLFYKHDSVYRFGRSWFLSLQTGPANSFYAISKIYSPYGGAFINQISSTDGTLIRQIPVSNKLRIASELGYNSGQGLYLLATRLIGAQTQNVSLQIADSNLNPLSTIPYSHVDKAISDANLLYFREDNKKGTYFFQFAETQFYPPSYIQYVLLGQLDSAGSPLWAIKLDKHPSCNCPFAITNIIPLAGNDFLVCSGYGDFTSIVRLRYSPLPITQSRSGATIIQDYSISSPPKWGIYPNPSSERIYFNWPEGFGDEAEASITNSLGIVVEKIRIVKGTTRYVDIARLMRGNYFLVLTDKKMGRVTSSFIKL